MRTLAKKGGNELSQARTQEKEVAHQQNHDNRREEAHMKRHTRYMAYSLIYATFLAASTACYSPQDVRSTRAPTEGTGEQVGEYIDDTVITAKVKAKLIDDPDLNAAEVNVETYKGVVQLSGFVRDPNDIAKASEVARKVNGVHEVRNDLQVKQASY